MIAPATGTPRLHRRTAVPAGVLDAGLTSAGTFLVGLAAVRYLPLEVLGTYALGYVAFLLAGNVAGVLVYTPAEVMAVAVADGPARLGVLRSSLRLGLPTGAAAALVVAAAVVAVPSTTPVPQRLALAASLVAFTALSPAQDHLRRLLHAADRPWDACATSALRLLLVVLCLGVLLPTGLVDGAAVPFGVLSVATGASAVWALQRARRLGQRPIRLTWARALEQGGLLVLGSLATFAGGFAMTAVVTSASGAAAVAQVEVVRLMSQPVTVVIVGLLSVVGPRIMAAAAAGDRVRTRHERRRPALLILGIAAGWVLLLSTPVVAHVVELVVHRAYDVPGLLQAMVLGQALAYAAPLWRTVLLARVRTRPLLAVDVVAAVLGLVLAVVLRDEGPWALVLSALASAALAATLSAVLARSVMRAADGRPSADRASARPGPPVL